jgi:hypothetical protein
VSGSKPPPRAGTPGGLPKRTRSSSVRRDKPLGDAERRLAEVTAQVIAKAEEVGLPDAPDKLVTPRAIQLLARAYLELRDQVGQLEVGGLESIAQSIQDRVDQIARVAIEGSLREVARQQGGIASEQIVEEAKSEGMLAAKPLISTYVNTMADARRLTFPCPRCGSVPGDNGVSGCAECVKLRVVPAPADVAKLSDADLLTIYCLVMRETKDVFVKHESYIVRAWDGMDGCWTDCTGQVDREKALRCWAERTDGGTRNVGYDEIDYYRIFPGGTRMLWDGSDGMEMHR